MKIHQKVSKSALYRSRKWSKSALYRSRSGSNPYGIPKVQQILENVLIPSQNVLIPSQNVLIPRHS